MLFQRPRSLNWKLTYPIILLSITLYCFLPSLSTHLQTCVKIMMIGTEGRRGDTVREKTVHKSLAHPQETRRGKTSCKSCTTYRKLTRSRKIWIPQTENHWKSYQGKESVQERPLKRFCRVTISFSHSRNCFLIILSSAHFHRFQYYTKTCLPLNFQELFLKFIWS